MVITAACICACVTYANYYSFSWSLVRYIIILLPLYLYINFIDGFCRTSTAIKKQRLSFAQFQSYVKVVIKTKIVSCKSNGKYALCTSARSFRFWPSLLF